MAEPVINFSPENMAAASPILYALNQFQAGQQAAQAQRAQGLENQLNAIKLKYEPQTIQSNLNKNIIQNALAKAQTQKINKQLTDPGFGVTSGIVGQMNEIKQMEKEYGPTDPRVIQAKDFINAQINQMNAKAKYYGSNVWAKNLPLIAKLGVLAQTGLPPSQGWSPNIGNQSNTTNYSWANNADASFDSGFQNTANQNNQAGNNPSSSPIDQEKMKDVVKSAIIHKNETSAQQNQKLYALTATNLYNQASQFVPVAAKYSDYAGTFDKLLDHIKSSSGTNSQEYNQLLKYKQTMKPLANEVRRVLGANATDAENKVIQEATDPSIGTKSPQAVIDLFNNLGEILKEQRQTLSLSPEQIQKSLSSIKINKVGKSTQPSEAESIAAEIARRKKAGTWD